jgi:hypothetical protein
MHLEQCDVALGIEGNYPPITDCYPHNFHLPSPNASLVPDSFPLKMPSRIPRLRCWLREVSFFLPLPPLPDSRSGAGEGTAPLQPRVSRPKSFILHNDEFSDRQSAKTKLLSAGGASRS